MLMLDGLNLWPQRQSAGRQSDAPSLMHLVPAPLIRHYGKIANSSHFAVAVAVADTTNTGFPKYPPALPNPKAYPEAGEGDELFL
jgi:hypothetical protein